MFRRKDRDVAPAEKRRNFWIVAGSATALGGVAALVWFITYRHDTRTLSRDTRVVVRVSTDAVDNLTNDKIREQFPIDEEVEGARFTGTLEAVGDVRVLINPEAPEGTFTVRVEGETTDVLSGVKPPVQFEGTGVGSFTAIQRMRFNGREFEALDLHVEAEHETTIGSVEPLPGTPLGPTVRLVAARAARKALPALDEAARERIRETVAERVSGMVEETVAELNRMNRFDETISILHPEADDWKIRVASSDSYVQAALVPEGGTPPTLPEIAEDDPVGIEVWLRLTRSERTAVRIAHHWDAAHSLFRRYIPEDQARTLAHDLRMVKVGDWTRLHVGAEATRSLRPAEEETSTEAG